MKMAIAWILTKTSSTIVKLWLTPTSRSVSRKNMDTTDHSLSAWGLSPFKHLPIQSKQENIKIRCEIWANLTMNKPERRHWHCSGVFIVKF